MDRLEWVKISSRKASEEMFTEAQVMTNKGLKKEVSELATVSYNQKMMVKSIQNRNIGTCECTEGTALWLKCIL